jgi:AcrR family transcriptional regulator
MSVDTKSQILDAAERLFAERGIDAVSIRSIVSEADVNLAAIHYHFGSKEALVEAVFERRVGPMNRERLALLDECESRAGDGPLEVEDIVRALVGPAIRLSHEPERGRVFMRIAGRFYSESAEFIQPLFDRLFRELIARFTAAFRRACPELPMEELFWRIQFMVGAMAHTMCGAEKLEHISGGLCDPNDVEGTIERMVQFVAAGMRAPVSKVAPTKEPVPVEAGGDR